MTGSAAVLLAISSPSTAKRLVRKRYQTLCRNMGIEALHSPEQVHYYTLIDLQALGGQLFGAEFAHRFEREKKGTDFLFRLAKETGVVLSPGKGFEVLEASARVSLANLTEAQYIAIGRFTRRVLDEYGREFSAAKS